MPQTAQKKHSTNNNPKNDRQAQGQSHLAALAAQKTTWLRHFDLPQGVPP